MHAQRVRVGRASSGCVATDRELGDRRGERIEESCELLAGSLEAGNALEADGESGRESTAAGRKRRGGSRRSEACPAGPEGGPAK